MNGIIFNPNNWNLIIESVSKILGHRPLRTTQYYAKIDKRFVSIF